MAVGAVGQGGEVAAYLGHSGAGGKDTPEALPATEAWEAPGADRALDHVQGVVAALAGHRDGGAAWDTGHHRSGVVDAVGEVGSQRLEALAVASHPQSVV